ncbi:MAG: hypothetical protein AB7E70_19415 [Hyphomicrobiaceae bacterium]
MIPLKANAGAAVLPFDLLDANGEWVTDYDWNDLGGGITDDFLVRLPDAGSGAVYANATIARLFQHGDGFGHYELASASNETDVAGKVYYRWLPSQSLVIPDETVTFDTTDNEVDWTGHGRKTGDGPIRFTTTGSLPSGLATGTDYWIIRRTDDAFSLATSKAQAVNNVEIDMTSAGSGTHTLVDTASTREVLWDYETRVRWEDIVDVSFNAWEERSLEGSNKPGDLLRGIFAMVAGKLTGLDAIRAAGGNGDATYYAADGVTPRITITHTTDGRTVITINDLT